MVVHCIALKEITIKAGYMYYEQIKIAKKENYKNGGNKEKRSKYALVIHYCNNNVINHNMLAVHYIYYR